MEDFIVVAVCYAWAVCWQRCALAGCRRTWRCWRWPPATGSAPQMRVTACGLEALPSAQDRQTVGVEFENDLAHSRALIVMRGGENAARDIFARSACREAIREFSPGAARFFDYNTCHAVTAASGPISREASARSPPVMRPIQLKDYTGVLTGRPGCARSFLNAPAAGAIFRRIRRLAQSAGMTALGWRSAPAAALLNKAMPLAGAGLFFTAGGVDDGKASRQL